MQRRWREDRVAGGAAYFSGGQFLAGMLRYWGNSWCIVRVPLTALLQNVWQMRLYTHKEIDHNRSVITDASRHQSEKLFIFALRAERTKKTFAHCLAFKKSIRSVSVEVSAEI